MSQTAYTLIKAALRAIGALASGETPSGDVGAESLEALQIMLRGWAAEGLLVHYITQDTLTMTGAASYTIGSGGDVDTVWPIEIVSAVRDEIATVRVCTMDEYHRFAVGNSGGDAVLLAYNPAYPLGVLYPWPAGGGSIVMDCLKTLTEPTALTDTISFPPPWDAAIKWNLAIDLAPEYEREPSAVVVGRAQQAKDAVRSWTAARQLSPAELSFPATGCYRDSYNIDAG